MAAKGVSVVSVQLHLEITICLWCRRATNSLLGRQIAVKVERGFAIYIDHAYDTFCRAAMPPSVICSPPLCKRSCLQT